MLQEHDVASRCKALDRILDDRQADRLTNDDKTLIVAIRPQFRDVTGEFGVAPAQGPEASSFAAKQGSIASHQIDHGAGQPGDAATAAVRGHRDGRAGTPLQAKRPKSPRWIIWTVSALSALVILAVVGWFVYSVLNQGNHPVPAQAPENAPTRSVEVSNGGDKKTTTTSEGSAKAPVAPGSASTAAMPAPEVEKSTGPPAVIQSPLKAEAPKSQK